MRMNLSSYPSAPKTYVADFPKLTGGLNLWELDYRMDANQSPDMKNLWWQDGVLQCRDGQVFISDQILGTGYTCYDSLFWGNAFFHVGGKIYYGAPDSEGESLVTKELCSGVPEARGTFFRYLDWLFYKNKGGFIRISYQPDEEERFKAEQLVDVAFTPVILLNASPEYGSGDLYQPENRISPKKTVRYNAAKDVKEYHLPVKEVDAIVEVKVDGEVKTPTTDYTEDLKAGTVTFVTAPPVTTPATNNTVEITYSKANEEAMKSIMDCSYAMVAGGDRSICILLAGSEEQPNAVFWNSNDNLSMNPAYYPMSYYNLVGDTEDPVSGFGRQYSDILVLKQHSVGKLEFTVETIDGRNSISFTYTNINSKTGCDLPWTIQLIENNLVFCNTYQGVHVVRSSSAAYENNIECISRNVNGKEERGLLADVRSAEVVASFDDDDRYWLIAGGNVYAWDYSLSTYAEPSWFFFENVPAVCMFQDDTHRKYHMDVQGRVTLFVRRFYDYGQAIEKLYRFPTLYFGSVDRLKDVTSVLISVRSDTDTVVSIRYDTDYESRLDLTPIRAFSWRLVPRNLAHRSLAVYRYSYVARRNPGCRHIRHFSMTFSNKDPGSDLAIVSAQVFYKFQGKER